MNFKKAIALVFSLLALASLCGCGAAGYNTDAATIDGLEITNGVSSDVTDDAAEVESIISVLDKTSVSSGRADTTASWQYHVRIFNSDGTIQLVEFDDGHIHYDGKTYKASTSKLISALESALQ